MRRISASLFACRSSPSKKIRSAVTVALRARRRITESAVTDLPEPDSPTMPSVSPASSLNESPLTAVTRPSSVRNVVRRLPTSSSGTAARVPLNARQREHEPDNHEDDREHAGQALELFLGAEATSVRTLDAAADRTGQPLLFGGLNRQQENQQERRDDEDAGEAVGEPRHVLRDPRLGLDGGNGHGRIRGERGVGQCRGGGRWKGL